MATAGGTGNADNRGGSEVPELVGLAVECATGKVLWCMYWRMWPFVLIGIPSLLQIESDGLEDDDVEIIDNGTSSRPGNEAQRNGVTRTAAQNGFASSSGGDKHNSLVVFLAIIAKCWYACSNNVFCNCWLVIEGTWLRCTA